jgi:hypothetical protein
MDLIVADSPQLKDLKGVTFTFIDFINENHLFHGKALKVF